jgi:hypothetical protein
VVRKQQESRGLLGIEQVSINQDVLTISVDPPPEEEKRDEKVTVHR